MTSNKAAFLDAAQKQFKDDDDETTHIRARSTGALTLIATSGNLYRGTIAEVCQRERDISKDTAHKACAYRLTSTKPSRQSNCFRSVQWYVCTQMLIIYIYRPLTYSRAIIIQDG